MSEFSISKIITYTIFTVAFALALTYTFFPLEPKQTKHSMTTTTVAKNINKAMTTALSSATIVPRRSGSRGHADHGWLNTYHTFSFASYYHPDHGSWGALRVLNEDRVAPENGFPTHPHRNFEIFSYIIDGQLTHRDSILRKGAEGNASKDQFYRMERGDVQFTTGGTGIAHSEQNEHKKDWVHFLQLWAMPWKQGLKPSYHTSTFKDADKRQAFVPIISPLRAGIKANAEEEAAAVPIIEGTIPVHADLYFNAGVIPKNGKFEYTIGAKGAESLSSNRKIYVHLPMTKNGKAKIRLDGRDNAVLNEGDGAYISDVSSGQILSVESIGTEEAEVVVVDSA